MKPTEGFYMRRTLALLVVALACVGPAYADDDSQLRAAPEPAPTVMAKPGFFDRHPMLFKATFPVRQPLKAAYNCTFPIRHPLQTGKWCEESGFNGLLGAVGGLGAVATPFAVGAFK